MSQNNPTTLLERVEAFIQLGEFIDEAVEELKKDTWIIEGTNPEIRNMGETLQYAERVNPWFTFDHSLFALKNIASSIQRDKLYKWMDRYKVDREAYDSRLTQQKAMKTVGVVLAGNIPFVGFHDYLCVLISGHRFMGKLSSEDPYLMPMINRLLIGCNPSFEELTAFVPDKLSGFEAIIATGSNNSNRYFDYYFGKYPHIFRRNRNSVALLTGNETHQQLEALADDIFLYYGKGCRSISKLFLPVDYNVDDLVVACRKYGHYLHHNKFRNNYDYNKAVYQMGSSAYWDCDFFILKEDPSLNSPISTVNFQTYTDVGAVVTLLNNLSEQLQCVVSTSDFYPKVIAPGQAQRTELVDYADGIDTMDFLMKL